MWLRGRAGEQGRAELHPLRAFRIAGASDPADVAGQALNGLDALGSVRQLVLRPGEMTTAKPRTNLSAA
jgi:hypothetical protein